MDSIYRDVPMSKVKFGAKHEYEYVSNFKVLQAVFDKHKIDNTIPVERLMKCRFQDNLEFLQWMKKYWDQYYPGGPYDALGRRKGEVVGGNTMRHSAIKAPSPHMPGPGSAGVKKAMSNSHMSRSTASTTSASTARKTTAPPRAAAAAGPLNNNEDAIRAELVAEYQKMTTQMTQQMQELKLTVEQVEKEREFYFSKLREIELYIQTRTEAGIDDHMDATFKEVQAIMYKTEDGFEIPETAEEATF
ncbi:hypothetical protein BDEG_27413 [Batrachochytrium dendrobatidis JEL423]|uniref:EB1 C-terminal domain-containing protein n=1 Tax=Batrachochytrium dendrobatidis (strain JEL423) TaxID=403673 RepID=A0A177WVR8_BATDL|nr:hypothetical protein BDEG_27413 [Batrachochytrium dendrobatidis JEL423]